MKSRTAVKHQPLVRALGTLLATSILAGALLAAPSSRNAAQAVPVEAGIEAPDVKVYVDGEMLTLDVFPRISRDRILVPMRKIFEELGAVVDWEPVERRITARRKWLTVELQIGEPEATLNSELTAIMDVPPVIVDDRTLVPLRFVSESLGADVDWDPATRSAHITMPTAKDADLALAHPRGTISDAPGDYQQAPEGAPQGGTFAFQPIDISKVIIGTDKTSLYVKVLLNGAIPSRPVTTEGFNEVNGLKIRIALNTDRNTSTGVTADKGAEAVLTYNANLQSERETASFFSGTATPGSSAAPTGTAFGNSAEEEYASHRIGRIVEGGIGADYVTMGFYLKDLGLVDGQEFDVYACAAAATPNWSAFSFDEAPNRDQRESVTMRVVH